jgi:transposase
MGVACARKPYPSDVSDEEWSLVVGYLTLMKEDAPQREHPLRELFNALRYVIRYGIAWRAMPNDFPPWHAVHQQAHRWLAAGCFEALAQDLRAVLRLAAGRREEPTAAIIDSRTLRSTPESGQRAGYDGAKRKRGSKVHMAVDTLGHLLALHVTAADVGDREAVARLAADIQEATGDAVSLAYVDQGYTGETAAEAAAAEGIRLEVVKLPGEARLRSPAQTVGCRKVLCVGHALQQTRQGLRTLRHQSRRFPRCRVRRIHAQASRNPYAKCITPSRYSRPD